MLELEGRRYRILETIGRGGFGTVYKAELVGQGGFTKMVALKILNDAVAGVEGTQERLRDEARMLGLLRHRSIVNVDGLLQLDGRWTVVMEYIEGVDLKQLLTRGKVPVGVAIEIIQEVANALYVAYERPIGQSGPMRLLHRDIKPSNLLISGAGEVKVLDFGVARAEFEAREARTSVVAFGSLGYMAPERLENENSHAGDVYALGAVLFELITGAPLGRTNPEPDAHDAMIDQALAKLWEVVPDEELYQVLGECIAYEPTSRPPARELERRLRSVRVRFPEPWLSDWAEDVVPEVLKQVAVSSDERVGNVLTESSAPGVGFNRALPSMPPAPAPPLPEEGTLPEISAAERDQAPRLEPELDPLPPEEPQAPEHPPQGYLMGVAGVLAAAFGASVVIGLGLAVAAWVLLPEERASGGGTAPPPEIAQTLAPEASGEQSAALAVVPTPTEAQPVEAQPTEAQPTEAQPVEAQPTEVAAKPEVAAPEQTAKTEAPATPTAQPKPTGNVVILGDMTGIRLFKGARSYGAGRVPTGTYTVRSTTDPSGKSLGEVNVKTGQTVTLNCKVGFPFCVVK